VIWGEQDRIINPAYADMFASGITGAKIAMVSNAGHLPQLEQPEKVIEEIEDFLR
jgi:pimeloyl-ACP methyl ester carboxylesterase